MKKYTCILFLFFLFTAHFQSTAIAASIKLGDTELVQQRISTQQKNGSHVFKSKKSKKGWFSNLKKKFQQVVKKERAKASREKAKIHLYICLGMVVLSIITFALSPAGEVFSILGSVFAIGAAVFFVLWLLNFTGAI